MFGLILIIDDDYFLCLSRLDLFIVVSLGCLCCVVVSYEVKTKHVDVDRFDRYLYLSTTLHGKDLV